MFSDNSGGISSYRVLLFGVVLLVMAVWAFVAFHSKSMPDIPSGVQVVLSALIAGKVTQRFGEKTESAPAQDSASLPPGNP